MEGDERRQFILNYLQAQKVRSPERKLPENAV